LQNNMAVRNWTTKQLSLLSNILLRFVLHEFTLANKMRLPNWAHLSIICVQPNNLIAFQTYHPSSILLIFLYVPRFCDSRTMYNAPAEPCPRKYADHGIILCRSLHYLGNVWNTKFLVNSLEGKRLEKVYSIM
jgi:hypothetical protein